MRSVSWSKFIFIGLIVLLLVVSITSLRHTKGKNFSLLSTMRSNYFSTSFTLNTFFPSIMEKNINATLLRQAPPSPDVNRR